MHQGQSDPRNTLDPPLPETDVILAEASPSTLFCQRTLTATIVGAIVVLGSFFASPVLLGKVPIQGDLSYFNLPIRDFYARCLINGDAFDWMPQCFGGFFITGEGQHGPYHPLHWLLYRWLPLDTAFALEVFLPVVVLALGMIVFLRRYVGFTGACMGAMAATFSAMFVQHLQHPQLSMVLAHIPWLLAAIDAAVRASTAGGRRWACVAIALVTGSQFLLGHPQATWTSLLTGALFGGFMLVAQRSDWRSWIAVVAGVLLGVCLGAVQLFSTYSYFSASDRAVFGVDVFQPAIASQSFIDNIAPYRMGFGFTMFPNYVGGVSLMLTLWWLTACWSRKTGTTSNAGGEVTVARDGKKRWSPIQQLSVWAVFAAVVAAVLAMGREGGLYRLLTLLPVVGNFRGPGRYLNVTQFCIAIVAAMAFAQLIIIVRSGRKPDWRHLILPWSAAAASVVLAVYYSVQANSVFNNRDFQWQFFTGPLFVGGAAIALTLAARGRYIGLLSLVLLAAVDLGVYSVDTEMGRIYWHHLPSYQEYLTTLRSAGISDRRYCDPPPSHKGRICQEAVNASDWFTGVNRQSLTGYRAINGYAAMSPTRKLDYRHLHTLRVAEVAWFRQRSAWAAAS